MQSPDRRAAFDRLGLVELRGAIDTARVQEMADAVWSFLTRTHGVDRDDRSTWSTQRPVGFQPLTRSGALDASWAPSVEELLAELVGPGELQNRERVRILMTFPQPEPWTVPSEGWHFDYTPPRPGLAVRAVQVFALLSDVAPRGGGTVVLTGSHRLVSAFAADTGRDPRPRDVRGVLGTRHPWLGALWGRDAAAPGEERTARFLDRPATVGEVDLCVTEVTGRAGDVFVMHSDCFHAITTNALRAPRLMSTSLVIHQPEPAPQTP